MIISVKKLELTLANQCKTSADLQPGISTQTIRKIKKGLSVRPDSVGRIARALQVPVTELIEQEGY